MPNDGTTLNAQQTYYRGMVAARRRLVRPMVITVLIFYFTLAILTNFTAVLDGLAFTGMTWAYIYAFCQFIMVIILTTVYRRGMDRAESQLRPADADESAAHYDDWQSAEAQTVAEGNIK